MPKYVFFFVFYSLESPKRNANKKKKIRKKPKKKKEKKHCLRAAIIKLSYVYLTEKTGIRMQEYVEELYLI